MCYVLEEEKSEKCDVHLWRRLLWGLIATTQMPEPFGQSLPTRQWGWDLCGGSLVTKETVTVTFFMWSMGPWTWWREQDSGMKEKSRKKTETQCTHTQKHGMLSDLSLFKKCCNTVISFLILREKKERSCQIYKSFYILNTEIGSRCSLRKSANWCNSD